jgi:hypothetical protein
MIRALARGHRLNPKHRRLLLDALEHEGQGDRPLGPDQVVSVEMHAAAQWIGASLDERATALADLLDLADDLPQSRRTDDAPTLSGKVVAVHRALTAADLPHSIGGAIALAYYGTPRATVDVDINVFASTRSWNRVRDALQPLGIGVDVDREDLTDLQEVRLPWDRNDIHIFFAHDELQAAMPATLRVVPFAEIEIPLISPEHLVARKAMLDRPKDWVDIEAILVATDPLDLDEIEQWLFRLAGSDDPRLARFRALADRLCS